MRLKRIFDLILCVFLGLILAFPFILISLAVKFTSKGPVFHLSKRIGRNNQIFLMPKFRSMKINTPQLATHLLENPQDFLTPIGGFLRRSSLDELPQILSVIKGDMSFVGPRPALFNQDDLIQLRTEAGVHQLKPGITGWAQINGRDEIPIPEKVKLDQEYLKDISLFFDFKILLLTFKKVIFAKNISH